MNLKNVVVYQRNKSRKLLNVNHVLDQLKQKLGKNNWTVTEMHHSNERDGCETLRAMSRATVLITSHGFQSILLLFQPSHSLLVEVHPYQYV